MKNDFTSPYYPFNSFEVRMTDAEIWKQQMLSLSEDHTEHTRMLEKEIRSLKEYIFLLENTIKILRMNHEEGVQHG